MAGLDAAIDTITLPGIAKVFDIATIPAFWVLTTVRIILVGLLLVAAIIWDITVYWIQGDSGSGWSNYCGTYLRNGYSIQGSQVRGMAFGWSAMFIVF